MEIKNIYDQKPLWMHIIIGISISLLSIYLILLARNAWREYDYIGKSAEFPHTINITGNGKVLAIPDIATITLGLETEKITVAQAQDENTKKMNRLYDELKKLEIAKEDISTTQYNVYPKYEWSRDTQIFKGYTVTQNVTLKIRNFDKISNILDLVGKLELNQVNNLNFTVNDPEKLQQEARIKAIKNAREKAQTVANEVKIKLGRIVSFSEMNEYQPTPYKNYSMEAGIGGSQAAIAPNIEPGSQEINIQINLVYEIL